MPNWKKLHGLADWHLSMRGYSSFFTPQTVWIYCFFFQPFPMFQSWVVEAKWFLVIDKINNFALRTADSFLTIHKGHALNNVCYRNVWKRFKFEIFWANTSIKVRNLLTISNELRIGVSSSKKLMWVQNRTLNSEVLESKIFWRL